MRTNTFVIPLKGLAEGSLTTRFRAGARFIDSSWICRHCRSFSIQRIRETKCNPRITTRLQTWTNKHNGLRSLTSSRQRSVESTEKNAEQHELPSKQEFRRSRASKQLSHMMDNIQSNIFVAGQRLNDLTGYSAIEVLKRDIQTQENLVRSTRDSLREAKEKYAQAIQLRSQSQREVNELLQRKQAWTPQDLERFTSLYRSDHANEQAESEAQAALAKIENAAEEAAEKLNANILARYHEEQVWSDKIRRMSTWGTWGLMGVNVLLFLVFQIGVEPWRRKRLVKGFEEKVVEALEKETAIQKGIAAAVTAVGTESTSITDGIRADNKPQATPIVLTSPDRSEATPPRRAEGVSAPERDSRDEDILIQPFPGPRSWTDGWTNFYNSLQSQIFQLFGTQQVQVRQLDMTTKFIEGAACSAVMISIVAAVSRGR